MMPGRCFTTVPCLLRRRDSGSAAAPRARAETDLEADLIPRPDFDRLMVGDDAFRAQVFASIARRFADFERMVETLAFTALEARVAAALLRMAGPGRIAAHAG